MSKWQEKTKRPVLPVYMAALVWPIMALLVPIYTLGGLVLRPYGSLAQIHYRTKSVHLQPSARKNGAKAAPHAACSRAGDQAALAGLVLGSTTAGRWVRGSAYFA